MVDGVGGEGTGDGRVRAHWPADTAPDLSPHTVGSLLRARAGDRPDSPALVHVPADGAPALRLSTSELLDEASAVAGMLVRRTPPGGRVAIWAPNVREWPVVEYAAALAGRTLVTLNPSLRAEDLRHALGLSRSTLLLHADADRGRDLGDVVAHVRGDLPELEHVVPLADRDRLVDGPPPDDRLPVDPRSPAQIQFTSGTTGSPKAVVLSHEAVVNVARFTFEVLGVRPGSVVVSPLPMFHTAGCVVSCLGPLWAGATFVLLEQFRPRELIDTLRREHADVLTSVPTVLVAALRAAEPGERLPVLRSVLTGAAPVRTDLIRDVENAFGTSVFNLYGQTEMAPVVSLTRPDDPPEVTAATVGRPLPHLECRIADPVTGLTCAVREPGEIRVRGYQRMLGYFGDDAATRAAVDDDGWLRTGDIGLMDTDGALVVVDRLKDMIIRGGENIAPARVEASVMRIDGIREAAVVGTPDEVWGEQVAAVVVLEQGRTADVAGWDRHCRGELSTIMVPGAWFVADALPLTGSGKVAKTELRAAIAAGALAPVPPADPAAAARTA